jgi:nucleoid-associated protein YgaU
VNRSTKLLLAAGLIAAGYGVATLIGSPKTPYVPRTFHPPATDPTALLPPTAQPITAERVPPSTSGVRLLPQVAADQNVIRAHDEQPASITPLPYPTTGVLSDYSSLFDDAPIASRTVAAGTQFPDPSVRAADTAAPASHPVGSLRPRFIDAPPRAARNDAGEIVTTTPKTVELPAPPPAAAPPTWPIERAVAPPTGSHAAEVSAAYLAPSVSASPGVRLTAIAPPLNAPAAPPRTHRIIDGDSLQKLAKRYLQDANRADEIYAMNRDVLANPDLLPIGAEIKLPAVKATGHGG